MTGYNDLFAAIVAPALNDGPGGHGEEVVYLPNGKPERRAITVRVNRDGREQLENGTWIAVVTFKATNSATAGISRAEFKQGLDEIEIALKEGGRPEPRKIGAVLDESGGEIEFRVG